MYVFRKLHVNNLLRLVGWLPPSVQHRNTVSGLGGEQLAEVFRSKTFNLKYNEQRSKSDPGEMSVESGRKTGTDDVPTKKPKGCGRRKEKKGKNAEIS